MTKTSTDCIEKRIELKAPVAKVWQALTDYKQFGAWFGVDLEMPFVAGKLNRGQINHPSCGQLTMEVWVQKIEAESLFSYQWHPYAIDTSVDYSSEPCTLVEFKLEKITGGTLLVVTESGFDSLPVHRRDLAVRMNSNGWEEQLRRIDNYVSKAS